MANYFWIGGGTNNNWSTVANWSTASAGTTTASVAPSSLDDVIFNGQGINAQSSSNINTAFTINSLIVSSSYSSSISHSANLTIRGNLDITGSYTIVGNGGLIISGTHTSYIAGNNKTFSGSITFQRTAGGKTSLSSSLIVLGSCTISSFTGTQILDSSGSATLFVSGGLSGNFGGTTVSGSMKITLKGGTWNGNIRTANFNIGTLTLDGNITCSTNTCIGGSIKYLSGNINTNGNTLYTTANTVFDTYPLVWNSIRSQGHTNTLLSDLYVSGAFWQDGTATYNSASIYITGSSSYLWSYFGSFNGTSTIILKDSAWVSSNNIPVTNPMIFSGSVVLSGDLIPYGGTGTPTASLLQNNATTLTVDGSTFYIHNSPIFRGNNFKFNNFRNSSVATLTLSSSLYVSGTMGPTSNAAMTINGFSDTSITSSGFTLLGNLILNRPTIWITGSWSQNATSYGITPPSTGLLISGNVTLSGANPSLNSGLLDAVQGSSINSAGSTLSIRGNSTINLPNIQINNLSVVNTSTITLSSSLSLSGSYSAGNTVTSTVNRTTSETFNINGGISAAGAVLTGNAIHNITGGTVNVTSTAAISSVLLNISGSIIISALTLGNGCTINYLSGSVNTSNSTLTLNNATQTHTLNTNGIIWNNIYFNNANISLFLSSSLYCNGDLILGQYAVFNISGKEFNVSRIISNIVSTGTTFTIPSSSFHIVRDGLFISSSRIGANSTITSNSATERTYLTLLPNALCNTHANFTRIDASLGRPIRTFNGTITDCRNIEQLTDIITSAGSFVATI